MIDSTLLPLIFNINQIHIHNLSKKKKLTTKIKYFEFSFNANFNQKEKTKEIAIKKNLHCCNAWNKIFYYIIAKSWYSSQKRIITQQTNCYIILKANNWKNGKNLKLFYILINLKLLILLKHFTLLQLFKNSNLLLWIVNLKYMFIGLYKDKINNLFFNYLFYSK